jgi:recombination endonuclease VII
MKHRNSDLQKPCVRCGEVDRLPSTGACRACHRTYIKRPDVIAHRRERYAANAEQHRVKNRSPERRKYAREWAAQPEQKAKQAARKLMRDHGLTPDQLETLRASQDGKCAVCGDPLKHGATHIDHDHATGQFRGLLCQRCNMAEGLLKGSPTRARRLAEYLESHAPRLRLVGSDKFETDLVNPETGAKSRTFALAGKVDGVVRKL